MLPEAGHAVLSAGQFRSTASRHRQGCTLRPVADSGARSERKDGAATAGVTAGPRAALLGVLSKCGRAPKGVRRSACRGERWRARWRARRCFSGGGVFARDAQGHEAAGGTCVRLDAPGRAPSALRVPGGLRPCRSVRSACFCSGGKSARAGRVGAESVGLFRRNGVVVF